MPLYKYDHTVSVTDEQPVYLKVKLPDSGSTAHHIVDLPGPNDTEAINDFQTYLGTGAELKKERTIIFTKAANISSTTADVKVNYYINDELLEPHSNPKTEDPSPQIKLKLIFK